VTNLINSLDALQKSESPKKSTPTTLMCPNCGLPVIELLDHFRPNGNIYMYNGSWTSDIDWTCKHKPDFIYNDCDNRVDTNYVYKLAWTSGTNFIGVYEDMAAVYHGEDDLRYGGVAMYSTCFGYQGEYLKDISDKDFRAIFVDKTKPEYSH
jgi:hypothetical protein